MLYSQGYYAKWLKEVQQAVQGVMGSSQTLRVLFFSSF